jgi:hypothetical protein
VDGGQRSTPHHSRRTADRTSWQRATQARAEAANAAEYADRDARCAGTTTAGPLVADGPPMGDAAAAIRSGQVRTCPWPRQTELAYAASGRHANFHSSN